MDNKSADFSDPARRIIVALDVSERERLLDLVRGLRGHVGMFKVGLEVYTALGPQAVEMVLDEGCQVFLDLKYHDIPNTVAGAMRAAARMGVSMMTVHGSGGPQMLKAAVEAAREVVRAPLVVAVSVLTSLAASDLDRIGLQGPPQEAVLRLAEMSLDAGVDGLVASARELTMLRSRLGNKPLVVCPGIRPTGAAAHDQQRVATPRQAVLDGADFLVIGRPITQAEDPARAADAIADELVED